MTSERKKQLIYECASEAVMLARIKIRQTAGLIGAQIECVDDILSTAQRNAGRWAVDASEADTRVTKNHRDITAT